MRIRWNRAYVTFRWGSELVNSRVQVFWPELRLRDAHGWYVFIGLDK